MPNLPLDDNRNPITNFDNGIIVSKTIDFSIGTTGSTSSAPYDIFNVTGVNLAKVWGVCTSGLAGANSSISVGFSGSGATANLIAVTLATDVDTNEIWRSNTPDNSSLAFTLSNVPQVIIADGLDIVGSIAETDVSAGVIDFYCLYVPISNDAVITAA